MNNDELVKIKYASKHASTANAWKKWIGENRGINRLNTIEKKQELEAGFTDWVNSSNELKVKYGTLLNGFKNVYKELTPLNFNSTYLIETGFGVEIIRMPFLFKSLRNCVRH